VEHGRAHRVGVIGHGAIGSVVASELAAGHVARCTLAGVLTRSHRQDVPQAVGSLDELLDRSDIVVEAAGHDAVVDHAPRVLGAGIDMLVVSVGALVDDELRERLTSGDLPGRLLLSSGAIGGLGLMRAAARLGAIDSVRLTTTKAPDALLAAWMTPSLIAELRTSTRPVPVFEGTAREAVEHFPNSVNVSATLALATLGLDRTRVTVVADRTAVRVRHVIEVDGDAGHYELHIDNTPSSNPRTSAITPFNVLRALSDMSDGTVVGL
jgi:aspartate dehydrogenase